MSFQLSKEGYDNPDTLPFLLSEAARRDPPGSDLHRLQRVRVYEAGETVLSQGEGVGMFGKVIDGILKMVKVLPGGREQIVGLLFPGTAFGHLSYTENAVAIEAATQTTLCYIRHPRMDRLITGNKDLEDAFLHCSLEALEAARDWMAVLASHTITQRLSTFLLMLLDRTPREEADDGSLLLSIPICRSDVAAFLGTTHETLSRAVHGLDRDGVIRIEDPHRFEILDLRRLRRLADGDRS